MWRRPNRRTGAVPRRVARDSRCCSRETLFLHHRPGVVKRFTEAAHHLVDLGLADDQWWSEGNDVAGHVAQYRTVMLCAAHEIRGDAGFGVEALLGRLVADKFHRTDQPHAAYLADEWMIGVAANSCLHPRADAPHL